MAKRAHPDLNQGPADLQSAALTTELCTHLVASSRPWPHVKHLPVHCNHDSPTQCHSSALHAKKPCLRGAWRKADPMVLAHRLKRLWGQDE